MQSGFLQEMSLKLYIFGGILKRNFRVTELILDNIERTAWRNGRQFLQIPYIRSR